jgi:hypothetical protein
MVDIDLTLDDCENVAPARNLAPQVRAVAPPVLVRELPPDMSATEAKKEFFLDKDDIAHLPFERGGKGSAVGANSNETF